ncbi:hypothetical protein [Cryptosporangium sp. NPDC048952]|uniref:hypothetical protein n=1 Tax=Cryptosporangium sp. NPDC048952 TaxID=3363961 RepID=UPI00371126A1
MRRSLILLGIVVATAAVSAGIGSALAAADGRSLSAKDAALGAGVGITVGLVLACLAGLVVAVARARGIKLASPINDLNREDRLAVIDALRRPLKLDDPWLRSVADNEANRQVKVLRFVLSSLPIAAVGAVWQAAMGDSTMIRVVGVFQVLSFTLLITMFWVQWRRARRYLAISD